MTGAIKADSRLETDLGAQHRRWTQIDDFERQEINRLQRAGE
jgi:hypothetical protein